MVVLKKDEEIKGVELHLQKGGVITGRVTDASNQPLIACRISIQKIIENGQKRGAIVGNHILETDDRGIYRIYGLTAGKYLVSATQRSSPNSNRRMSSAFFAPGVRDESQGKIIEVDLGSEVSGIDIQVPAATNTVNVAGRAVIAETGEALWC